jgi:hypothetical protein
MEIGVVVGEAGNQRALRAIRPQLRVDAEQFPMRTGTAQRGNEQARPFIQGGPLIRGDPGGVVHEYDVDVGAVVEFVAAQLSQRNHGYAVP